MARYLYYCAKCDKNIEIEKSMLDSAREESCSSCHEKLRRIFTAPSMHLKQSCGALKSEQCSSCDHSCCHDH